MGRRIGIGQFRMRTAQLALVAVLCGLALSAEDCSGSSTGLPSTGITATATPTESPSATPTPAPSQEPVGEAVTFPNGPASGHRGQTARLTARYRPGVSCTIVVYYKSGPSRAKGLTAKTTNGAGLVSWSWFIGTN